MHVVISIFSSFSNMGPIFTRDMHNGFGIAPSHYAKRLLREMQDLTENANVRSYFRFESSGEHAGRFCIYGYLLPGTPPYNNGEFKVCIALTADYPFQPPELQLLTPLYHPSVDEDMSKPKFCCTCCRFSSTSIPSICDFIKYYVDIIDHPNTACTCNYEAHQLYRIDKTRYEQRALDMVRTYAGRRPQINP